MPTSAYGHLGAVVRHLNTIRPSGILDIGVGNGKMGFVARDLLDVMLGQCYLKRDWKVRIDGIEIFEPYIQEHQRFIYDRIYIGDAREWIDRLGSYDLIILGDVLEHFEKDHAWDFLKKCFSHCNHSVLINLPLGENWTQEAIYENEYERHRSFWEAHEFQHLCPETAFFENPDLGLYGVISIPKQHFLADLKIVGADQALGRQDRAEALRLFLEATELMPVGKRAYLEAATLLVEERRISDAVRCLETARRHHPEDGQLSLYLYHLRRFQKDPSEQFGKKSVLQADAV